MPSFEILYKNLTKETQANLCVAWNTCPEDENWDVIPVAIIEQEEDYE